MWWPFLLNIFLLNSIFSFYRQANVFIRTVLPFLEQSWITWIVNNSMRWSDRAGEIWSTKSKGKILVISLWKLLIPNVLSECTTARRAWDSYFPSVLCGQDRWVTCCLYSLMFVMKKNCIGSQLISLSRSHAGHTTNNLNEQFVISPLSWHS